MDTSIQSNPSGDEVIKTIIKELDFENIKNEDDFIKYVIRIYWDQWKYRIYRPIWIYIFWWMYYILLFWLLYIGLNGGATSDTVLRKEFFTFWVTWSNIMYFYIAAFLIPGIIYPFLRTYRFNIWYSTLCILYHIIPFIWIGYSIIHYFMKGTFFQKQWFFSVLKLYLALLFVPFTFKIWVLISSIIF